MEHYSAFEIVDSQVPKAPIYQGIEINSTELEKDSLSISFNNLRHLYPLGCHQLTQTWRIRDRMKTVSVALVVCLNVGVDPPDVIKIQPCARLECWTDPTTMSPQKAMEQICKQLQTQYERWQPRARYKQSPDPTVDDIRKLCQSLRRNAKEERVLFHYNGHGVPKPTTNGEIWVFNKTYTQYIPLSIYDLQKWMGAPSIYVYDCSNAGIIVNSFHQFAEQHEKESPILNFRNCIQLAACAQNQILPMNPLLPADLFTSCLTTPIRTALKWFTLQNQSILISTHAYDLIEKIPGQLNDRRTMLGELNWIFTAITDTIAWNTLPRDLFQRLFRQDLLVASLFRNFLLADRVMRAYDCSPISSPPLPDCHRHPMWLAWDYAVDLALQQLPDIVDRRVPYKNSTFFEDQLTAFSVWLQRGSAERQPPEQLPIVLQVLLSQVHRQRALDLLSNFLDLGPWAVNLALSVGIFPYVLKLLQASGVELREKLVFIWAKILAVDSTCQVDLIRDHGHKYFLAILHDFDRDIDDAEGKKNHKTNSRVQSNKRCLAAIVLSSIVHHFPVGQKSALQSGLIAICLEQLDDPQCPKLRQWLAICLGNLWENYDAAKWSGVRDLAPDKLYQLLNDPVPEVRAAAVYALGNFIHTVDQRTDHSNNIDRSIAMTLLNHCGNDMSPMVRIELLCALQWIVLLFENHFVNMLPQHSDSFDTCNKPIKRVSSASSLTVSITGSNNIIASSSSRNAIGFGSIYLHIWNGINNMTSDAHPDVAELAQRLIDYITTLSEQQSLQSTTLNMKSEIHNESPASLSLPPSPNINNSNYLYGSRYRKHQTSATYHISIKQPIVQSRFFQWSINQFSQSKIHDFFRTQKEIDQWPMEKKSHDRLQIQIKMKYKANNERKKIAVQQRNIIMDRRIGAFQRLLKQTVTTTPNEFYSSHISSIRATINGSATGFTAKLPLRSPHFCRFHKYDPLYMAAYDDRVLIAQYGLSDNYYQLFDHQLGAVTDGRFINEHYNTVLATAYDTGVICIWRINDKFSLQTSKLLLDSFGCSSRRCLMGWQAVFNITKQQKVKQQRTHIWSPIQNRSMELGQDVLLHQNTKIETKFDWQQQNELLAVSNNRCDVVNIWSIESELKVHSFTLNEDLESAAKLIFCPKNPDLLAVGFKDGNVSVFDCRSGKRAMDFESQGNVCYGDAMNLSYFEEHGLICGFKNGYVTQWDTRKKTGISYSVAKDIGSIDFQPHFFSIVTMSNQDSGNLTIHDFNLTSICRNFLTAEDHQFIETYNCAVQKSYEGTIMWPKFVIFHPLDYIFASITDDSSDVQIYKINDKCT